MTKQLSYSVLPLSKYPFQVFIVGLSPAGGPPPAEILVRFFSAPGPRVISIWDNATGVLMVNQIPLICSYGFPLDLLFPFRGLRDGKGIGSMFLIHAADSTSSADPAAGNLTEFSLLFGDQLAPGEENPDG